MIIGVMRAGRSAGFTLVELLVAVALMALLTVALYDAFRAGTRAANAVGETKEWSVEIGVIYDFMQRELAAAEPLPVSTDPAQTALQFDGEEQALSFVTLPPASLAVGGFQRLHLGLENDAGGNRLIASWESVARAPAAPQPTMLRPSILVNQVRSIRFAYFGMAEPNQPPGWSERWTAHDRLPQLVRLQIVLADGEPMPDLIVALRLSDPPPS